MKKLILILTLPLMFMISCSKEPLNTIKPQNSQSTEADNEKAIQFGMQKVYFDNRIMPADINQAPGVAHEAFKIYTTMEMPGFIPVINVRKNGSILINESYIKFTRGHRPHQFYSGREVERAVATREIVTGVSGRVYKMAMRF